MIARVSLEVGKPLRPREFMSRLASLCRRIVSPRRAWLHGVAVGVPRALDAPTKRALFAGTYEQTKIAQLRTKVEPNDVFIDLGAGLGLTALFAATMVGDGKVVAVEADPRAAAMARANFALNGRAIELLEGAVVAGDGADVEFFPNDAFGASACFPRAGGIEAIRVPRLDLGRLLGERCATVVNVDVEGAEHGILAGIDDFADVRVLLVRIHEQAIGYPRSVALVRWLFDHGFAFDLAGCSGRQMVFAKA